MSSLRLFIVTFLTVLLTLIFAIPQLIAIRARSDFSRLLPMYWHRMILRLMGVRVHVHGIPVTDRPLLIVANHISWADIMVLSSIMPVSFIAKDDVKKMPGINLLAFFQRTVFVERDRRTKTANQANSIAARLVAGDAMVLFAEGTTGSGNKILPFKSALFGASHFAMKNANLESVKILPVAIAYTHTNGLPMGRFHQPRAATPGDVPVFSHIGQFVRSGCHDVHVAFDGPLEMKLTDNRKKVTRETEAKVRKLFAAIRYGSPLNNGFN